MQALAKIQEDILVFIGFKQVNVTNVRITPTQAVFDTNVGIDEFLREKIPVQIWRVNPVDTILLFDGVTKAVQPVKSKSHVILTKVTCESCLYHVLATTYLSTLIGNINEVRSDGVVKSSTEQILQQKFKAQVSVPTSDFKFLNAYLLERGRLPFDILQYMINSAAHTDSQAIIDGVRAYTQGVDFRANYTIMYVMTAKNQATYITSDSNVVKVDNVPALYVHNTQAIGYLDVYGFVTTVIPAIKTFAQKVIASTEQTNGQGAAYDEYIKQICNVYDAYVRDSKEANRDTMRLPLEARLDPSQSTGDASRVASTIDNMFKTYFAKGAADVRYPVLAFYALTLSNNTVNKSNPAIQIPLSLRVKLAATDGDVATTVHANATADFTTFVNSGLKNIVATTKDASSATFLMQAVDPQGNQATELDYWGILRTLATADSPSQATEGASRLYYYITYIMIKQWDTVLSAKRTTLMKSLQQIMYDSSFSKSNTSSTSLDYWRHAVMYKFFDFHKLNREYDADKIFDVFTLLKKNVGVEIITKHLSKISTSSYAEMFQTFFSAYGYSLVYTFPRYAPDKILTEGLYQYVEAILMPEQNFDLSPVLYSVIPSYLVRDYSKRVKLDTTDFLFRVSDRKSMDLLGKQVPQLYSMRDDKIFDMQDLDTLTEYTDDLYTEPRIIDLSINSAVASAMYEIKHERIQAQKEMVFQAATVPDPKGTFTRSLHITAKDFYKDVIDGVGAGKTLSAALSNTYLETSTYLHSSDGPWIVTIITLLNDYMKAHLLSVPIVNYMVRIALGELKAFTASRQKPLEGETDTSANNITALVGSQNLFPITVSEPTAKPPQPMVMNNFNESIKWFQKNAGSVNGVTVSDRIKAEPPATQTGTDIQIIITALETAMIEYASLRSEFAQVDAIGKARTFKVMLAQLCTESGFRDKMIRGEDLEDGFLQKAIDTSPENIKITNAADSPFQFTAEAMKRLSSLGDNFKTLAMRPKEGTEAAYEAAVKDPSSGGQFCKWYKENGKWYYIRLKMGINNLGGMRLAIKNLGEGRSDSVHGNYKSISDGLSVRKPKSYFRFFDVDGVRSRAINDPLTGERLTRQQDLVAHIAKTSLKLSEADFVEWFITLLRDLGYYEAGGGTLNYSYGYAQAYNRLDLALYQFADAATYKLPKGDTPVPVNDKTALSSLADKYGKENVDLVAFYVERYAVVRTDQLTEKRILSDSETTLLPWGIVASRVMYTTALTQSFLYEPWAAFVETFSGSRFVAATKEGASSVSGPLLSKETMVDEKKKDVTDIKYFMKGGNTADKNTKVTFALPTAAFGKSPEDALRAVAEEFGPVLVTIPALTLVRAINTFLAKGDRTLLSEMADIGSYSVSRYVDTAYLNNLVAIPSATEIPFSVVPDADSLVPKTSMASVDDIVEVKTASAISDAANSSELVYIQDCLRQLLKNIKQITPADPIQKEGVNYLRGMADVLLQSAQQMGSIMQDIPAQPIVAGSSAVPPPPPDSLFSPFIMEGVIPERVTLEPDAKVTRAAYFFGYKVAFTVAKTVPVAVPAVSNVEALYKAAQEVKETPAKLATYIVDGNGNNRAFSLFKYMVLPSVDSFLSIFLAAYAATKGRITSTGSKTTVWEDVLFTIGGNYRIATGTVLQIPDGQYSLRGVRGSTMASGVPDDPALDHYVGAAVDIQYTDFIKREGDVLERFMEDMSNASVRRAVAAELNKVAYANWLRISLPVAPVGIKKLLTGDAAGIGNNTNWSITIYSRHIHVSVIFGDTTTRGKSGVYKGEKQ